MKKLILVLAMVMVGSSASAATFNITWTFDNSPTATCADGMPAAVNCPLQGFQINSSTELNGTYTLVEPVGPAARSYQLLNVAAGTTRCIMLKAYTGTAPNWVQSAESNRVCATAGFSPPKAPQGLTVEVAVRVSFNSEGAPVVALESR